ncbi:MAG TPA: sigma 54-interacting transcriptional regulator [Myxococcales bacterium LLY-WYZ-16_1]|nr:sigma 54-interacting transcriptional regulator [Myxococcales bacterium LLY-WYZ-16_1]
MRVRVCVLAPDRGELTALQRALTLPGLDLVPLRELDEALFRARVGWSDLLLVRPADGSMGVLGPVRQQAPDLPVLWIGHSPPAPLDVDDVLEFPLDPAGRRFRHWLQHARLRRQVGSEGRLVRSWVGRSREAVRFRSWMEAAAGWPAPLLLMGPAGSGKRLAAELIHGLSERAAGPFRTLDCRHGGWPVLQRQLWGEQRGALAEDWTETPGLWSTCRGGTLLVRRIERLPSEGQRSLLEGMRKDPDRVRVIASAGTDLESQVRTDRFRPDLAEPLLASCFRLTGLHQRTEDVVPLANHFLQLAAAGRGRTAYLTVSSGHYLERLGWPENARSLRDRMFEVATQLEGPISAEQLQRGEPPRGRKILPLEPYREAKAEALRQFEREYLARLLEAEQGHVTRAADRAGMHRKNLTVLLRRHGLDPRAYKPARGRSPRSGVH